MAKAKTEWVGDRVKTCWLYRHKAKLTAVLMMIIVSIYIQSIIPIMLIPAVLLVAPSDKGSNHRRLKSEGVYFNAIHDGKPDDICYAIACIILPPPIIAYIALSTFNVDSGYSLVAGLVLLIINCISIYIFIKSNQRWLRCFIIIGAKRERKENKVVRKIFAATAIVLLALSAIFLFATSFSQHKDIIVFPVALFVVISCAISIRIGILAHGSR